MEGFSKNEGIFVPACGLGTIGCAGGVLKNNDDAAGVEAGVEAPFA